MRTAVVLIGCVCGGFALGTAQVKPGPEIGTGVGVTILSQAGTSLTQFGIPGNGIQGLPSLYAAFFASPAVMIEPQLGFTSLSSGGSTSTAVALALQVDYLFTPAAPASGYVAANAAHATASTSGSASSNEQGLGAEVGYRWKVKTSAAVRLNLRYRHWFSNLSPLNEHGVGLSLGLIL